VSFAAITLCVASQRVFIVVSVYFVIDSARKRLDISSYIVSFSFHSRICFIFLFVPVHAYFRTYSHISTTSYYNIQFTFDKFPTLPVSISSFFCMF